ncbi:uncharacterized protein LOC144744618 [Ciona intestinalis]
MASRTWNRKQEKRRQEKVLDEMEFYAAEAEKVLQINRRSRGRLHGMNRETKSSWKKEAKLDSSNNEVATAVSSISVEKATKFDRVLSDKTNPCLTHPGELPMFNPPRCTKKKRGKRKTQRTSSSANVLFSNDTSVS